MNNIIQSLIEHADEILNYVVLIDKEVRSLNLLNEQWFLDWQDKLNQLSVK